MRAGGRKRKEVDRIEWRWRRRLVVGKWKMRESKRGATSAKEKGGEGIGGERGGVERRGNVTVLSPVTCTDVWGGEEEQEEDGERTGEQRRSKKPPLRKATKRRRKENNMEEKIRG